MSLLIYKENVFEKKLTFQINCFLSCDWGEGKFRKFRISDFLFLKRHRKLLAGPNELNRSVETFSHIEQHFAIFLSL